MATKSIYFDESGFTGCDLLNPEQPIFCVASSDIGEQMADEILRASFPRYQGPEVKFGKIWSRWGNRKGLLRFAESIAKNQQSLFAYWIDKKFCILTKFVDFLIEPVIHDLGYDFYAGGYAPTFCNRFKFGLDNFCEPELYESTVSTYERFARNPTKDTLSHLEGVVTFMATSVPQEVRDYYEMALAGIARFREKYDLKTHEGSNEIQLTTILASIGYWRQRSEDEFAIIHDHSSNFFGQANLWSAITSPHVPSQRHPLPNGSSFPFPLRIASTTAGDSRIHRGIQLCDVLSGLVARAKRPNNLAEDETFISEVVAAGLGELTVDGIRPELKIAEGPPQKLDGPDVVDKVRNIIFGRQPSSK
jgi:Protein of unknown function (DUF3800)